jgi:hypothetical protein
VVGHEPVTSPPTRTTSTSCSSTQYREDPQVKKLIKVFFDPRVQAYLRTTTDPKLQDQLSPVAGS